jgi:thymidylate synthase (FAD)
MIKIKHTDLYNDGKGFVEQWDFSTANMDADSRVEAVTKIASTCYGKEAKDKLRLFNLLEAEALGLPSSAFEFVKVLLTIKEFDSAFQEADKLEKDILNFTLDMEKYGSWVQDDNGREYLLTNLRAVISDTKMYDIEWLKDVYNTSAEEIKIIKDNSHTFFQQVPIMICRQLVRHRVSYQELSRRYTNNETSPIEFYVKDDNGNIRFQNDSALNLYNSLVKHKTMKPEDARAVLGTGLYTKIWSQFDNDSLNNFLKLRDSKKAQSEIRDLASGMR